MTTHTPRHARGFRFRRRRPLPPSPPAQAPVTWQPDPNARQADYLEALRDLSVNARARDTWSGTRDTERPEAWR